MNELKIKLCFESMGSDAVDLNRLARMFNKLIVADLKCR